MEKYVEGGLGILQDAGLAIFYPRIFGFSFTNVRVSGFYLSDGLRFLPFSVFARVLGLTVKICGFSGFNRLAGTKFSNLQRTVERIFVGVLSIATHRAIHLLMSKFKVNRKPSLRYAAVHVSHLLPYT